jgi:hypothetical protein
MFESRVPRKISGSKKDNMAGMWRILHAGEIHNVSSSKILYD